MVVVNFLRLAALLSACVGVASSVVASTLQVHEARKGIPAGFTLHGAASPDTMLSLRVALVQGDFAGLEERLYDVSTPSSANYGKHLSKIEVERYVTPKPESVIAVNAWLANNGVHATSISPAGDWMAIEVPVSKANELLGAHFSVYKDDTTGRQIIRTLSYSIPAELKGHLDLVHPTITFSDIRPLLPVVSSVVHPVQTENFVSNAVPASCNTAITPACLQDIYGIPATLATQSKNQLGVSGFLQQFANEADLTTFLKQLRRDLSSNTSFGLQTLDGGQNLQDPSQAGVEANLDIQYTVGVASGVPVTFFSVGPNNQDGVFGFLDLINFLVGLDVPPQVLTTSYGADEFGIAPNLVQALCNAYAQLGARGTSILFASGDGGVSGSQAQGCTEFVPTFPSGCPYLTSVGATQVVATAGVVNETAAAFSAGGFSNVFSTPSYQQDAVAAYLAGPGETVDVGRFNKSGRAYPDVSALGVDYAIALQGQFGLVSGTSAASPLVASIIALINDELIAKGKPPLGFLNPFLYSEAGASALNDVTVGSNPGCASPGFPAAQGWDPVTGLGTPNFDKLLAAALAL